MWNVVWAGMIGALGYAVWVALNETGSWSGSLNFGGEYGSLLGGF